MVRIFAGILTAMILAYFSQLILPWWSIVIATAIVSFLFNLSFGKSFIIGFTSIAILWGAMAFYIDTQNDSLLSTQIARIFGNLSSYLLIVFTLLLGGISGGLGALVGRSARNLGL